MAWFAVSIDSGAATWHFEDERNLNNFARNARQPKKKALIMKKLIIPLTFLFALSLIMFTGCSGSGVDTSKVQSAFSSAPAVDKTDVDSAVSAVKAGDYQGALASLQKVAANAKLTADQKAAIQDLVAQIQNKLAGAAKQAGDSASKAAGDLQKSLGK